MTLSPRLGARLTLEAASPTPDGGGGASLAWAPLGHLWGEIEARAAREATAGDRRINRVTHRITVRRGTGAAERPSPGQRLVHRGRVFAIHGVAEAAPGAPYLTIWAEEGPFS